MTDRNDSILANYHCTENLTDNHNISTAHPPSVTAVDHLPFTHEQETITPDSSYRSFTVYYQNVRGLRTKTNDLLLALSHCDYDVIALTETWLNESFRNTELAQNYTIYRCDRNAQTSRFTRGGGVMIAVKNGLQSTAVCVSGCDQLEQAIVRISLSSLDVIVCSIYLPPNSEAGLYEQHAICMSKLMDLAGDRNVILAVGDYNLPHLCWITDENLNCLLPINASSEQETVLVESVMTNGTFQINNLTNVNGRLLDLAFVSDASRIELFEPPLPLLGIDQHHRPFVLLFELTDDKKCVSSAVDPLHFDFSRCDFELLNRLFTEIRWEDLFVGCDVEEAVGRFYEQVYGILRDVVPLKQPRCRRSKRQPWWNNELQNLRNRLRKARKRFFRNRNERHKAVLRDIESEYNSLHAYCFRCYIHRIEDSVKDDPKSFWTFVKNRKQLAGLPQRVSYNNITAESSLESANLFSSFFRSVQSNNRPPPAEAYLNSLPSFDLNMALFTFSPLDVLHKFQSIDGSKGAGPDRLPPLLFKNCATSLAMPSSIIFNASMSEGIFPSLWKTAAITPIHKSGSVHDVTNYRAISILSCLPKIFESLIHDTLYPKVQHIFSEWQHGFVKKRSTTTNLLAYVSSLNRALGKHQQVDAIYVDFAKAFDRVPQFLMVEKLDRMGFPGWLTRWILSYLTERSAYVRIDGVNALPFVIESGVPQGSHLGPLLFILFVNDLCTTIASPKYMFADDLKFFRVITSTIDCCAMQADIDLLLNWCKINGMEVNAQKCSVISFNRNRNVTFFDYKMSSTSINRVNTVKDLGILLDSKLSFSQHIAVTTAKAYAVLGFVKRNTQQFTDIDSLKSLYFALVRSVLEYGVLVWAPYQVVQISRIERIQRQFIRYALRSLPWRDPHRLPPYEHRCALIRLPTLANRRTMLQQLFIFDLLENNVDSPELLSQLRFNVPPRITRRTEFFRPAMYRTVFAQNNPFYVCCRNFNIVSESYVFSMTKTNFRSRISIY